MSNGTGGAVIIDASVAIAICARESGRERAANAELLSYSGQGYQFYAPGAIVAETLYVLCGKMQQGLLTPVEHARAILDFESLMNDVLGPPGGEAVNIGRAEAIRVSYGCSRSADGIYLAMAESLARNGPAVILTFDQNMQNQSVRNSPSVTYIGTNEKSAVFEENKAVIDSDARSGLSAQHRN